jgi:hypothetical protein
MNKSWPNLRNYSGNVLKKRTRYTSVRIADVLAENRTELLPNPSLDETKQTGLDQDPVQWSAYVFAVLNLRGSATKVIICKMDLNIR